MRSGCGHCLSRHQADREHQKRVQPPGARKGCGKHTANAYHHSTTLHTLEGSQKSVTACAIQHDVAVFGHLLEACTAVVNCDIGTQTLHEVDIALPDRGEDRCTEMVGELNSHGSDSAAACVNQNSLAGTSPSQSHTRLPR